MSMRELVTKQIDEIERTLYGMRPLIKIFCLSKICDLTVLLLGAHATAKSSLARMWSITTGLNYRVVTSTEIDESMIAFIDPAIFREKNLVQMRRGELMEKNHIIIDEYFLWLNKYRAKLHQLLEERTYAGLDSLVYTYTFLSNPLSEYYAGQIEEKNLASIDRIDLFIPVNQPKIVPCESMVRKFSRYGRREKALQKIMSWDDYQKAREEVGAIIVPSRVTVWLTLFAHAMSSCKLLSDKFSVSVAKLKKGCAACNENNHLCAKVALSKPRFLRATIILAKGLAWLDGRTEVSFSDMHEAINFTLPHRLVWIQEDLSYSESLDNAPKLVQQFNDEMLTWTTRGIFKELTRIVDSSKKNPPVFEEKAGGELLRDIVEIHILKDFILETLDSIKGEVIKVYLLTGRKETFISLEELKAFLEQSGLNPFDKSDLLFSIGKDNPNLTHCRIEQRRTARPPLNPRGR